LTTRYDALLCETAVRAKGPRASPDLAPELAARWPAAGKTKTEEGTGRRKPVVFFGFAVGEEDFACLALFLVRDSNTGIGLVFAFLSLETV